MSSISGRILSRITHTMANWSHRIREYGVPEHTDKELEHERRSPFGPILPSYDYLEAMMGDFLEQQHELQQQKGASWQALYITILRLISLCVEVLAITWQNLSVSEKKSPPVSPPSSSSLDEIEVDEYEI